MPSSFSWICFSEKRLDWDGSLLSNRRLEFSLLSRRILQVNEKLSGPGALLNSLRSKPSSIRIATGPFATILAHRIISFSIIPNYATVDSLGFIKHCIKQCRIVNVWTLLGTTLNAKFYTNCCLTELLWTLNFWQVLQSNGQVDVVPQSTARCR